MTHQLSKVWSLPSFKIILSRLNIPLTGSAVDLIVSKISNELKQSVATIGWNKIIEFIDSNKEELSQIIQTENERIYKSEDKLYANFVQENKRRGLWFDPREFMKKEDDD